MPMAASDCCLVAIFEDCWHRPAVLEMKITVAEGQASRNMYVRRWSVLVPPFGSKRFPCVGRHKLGEYIRPYEAFLMTKMK